MAVLEAAAAQLRQEKKYHELFEILKMQTRCRLGMSLHPTPSEDSLPEAARLQLEDGLIAACREIGAALVQSGQVREGWMYLRPVGDKKEAAALLSAVEADEENQEDLIEVLLHEGVDIGRGFGIVLSAYGTCSAITTYDSSVGRRPAAEQRPAARLLLHRLHADLLASVKQDITRQEGAQPPQTTLKALVHDREWLFQDNAYHIDTTHLASTVRIARVLDDPSDLRLALDLTEYGRHLNEQFQYPGDEPFVEQYPAAALFFQALLGQNIDAALAHFRERAEMLDPQYHGTVAIDVYVDLLARVGRPAEAFDAAIRLSPPGGGSVLSAGLLDLAHKSGRLPQLLEFCRAREDLLGYAACLAEQQTPA